MLDFQESVDIKKEVHSYIARQRPLGATKIIRNVTATILGQEKDGTIIYAWDDVSPYFDADNVATVTHVGIFDPAIYKHNIIFVHDKTISAVCCTVNEERTLLGFTVIVEIPGTKDGKEKGRRSANSDCYVYRSYLAEIQPQNRVFSLNIDRTHFLKVQFLYNGYRGRGNKGEREAHMLIQLHKESIGLYHIPLANAGGRIIMSGQPRTEQLAGKFVWSQWDCVSQRLYYVHHRKQKTQEPPCYPVMTCYQFETGQSFKMLFEINLIGLPIPRVSSKTKTTYLPPGPWHCTPDSLFNLEVLAQPNGTLCVCFQQPYHTPGHLSPSRRTPPENMDKFNLEYYVCIVHHAKILHLKVPNLSRDTHSNVRLYFSSVSDYILVHAPGLFTHLLNVSIELDPIHHILQHDEPTELDVCVPKYVGNLYKSSGSLMFNVSTGKVFKLSVSHEALYELFIDATSHYTRQAVLHYAAVHSSDLLFVKKLVEAICCDPASPEVTGLLKELLVGTTYSAVKKRLDRRIAKLLPFSPHSDLTGHCEKSAKGQKQAILTYSNFKGRINMANESGTKSQLDDMCENLYYHMGCRQASVHTRFDVVSSPKECIETKEKQSEKKGETAQQLQKSNWFLEGKSRIFDTISRKFTVTKPKRNDSAGYDCGEQDIPGRFSPLSTRTELILGTVPPFFAHEKDSKLNKQTSLSQSRLMEHLSKSLTKDSKEKIQNIAEEYADCQVKQSKQLVHTMWSLLGPTNDEYVQDSLNTRGTPRDCRLFQIFERYLLASQQLPFPLPPGFMPYFTKLTFRCLDLRLFLQYIDNGVVALTREFVYQVIEDTGQGNYDAISQMISRLSEKDAWKCLQVWKHPTARKTLTQKIVKNCLQEDTQVNNYKDIMSPGDILASSSLMVGSVDTNVVGSFPPMATLFKLLEAKDPHIGRHSRYMDKKFLEDSALYNLKAECGPDLSQVNF